MDRLELEEHARGNVHRMNDISEEVRRLMEYHLREAAGCQALLVEIAQSCTTTGHNASRYSNRKRFQDPVRLALPQRGETG